MAFSKTHMLCLAALLVLASTGCEKKPADHVETPAAPTPPPAAEWIDLRDGWQEAGGGAFSQDGDLMRLNWGETLTAVKWTGEVPLPPFEIEMEARRLDGTDFFCGLTFPARGVDECVTLIVGGWGGGLVGISSINGLDASENEARVAHRFVNETWYKIRLRRAGEQFEVWIDDEKLIDVPTEGKSLTLRPGPISVCAPFGLATWQSSAEIRNPRWRKLPEN